MQNACRALMIRARSVRDPRKPIVKINKNEISKNKINISVTPRSSSPVGDGCGFIEVSFQIMKNR
jgi:hypothetical protein